MVGVADQWAVAQFSRGFGLVSSSRLLSARGPLCYGAIGVSTGRWGETARRAEGGWQAMRGGGKPQDWLTVIRWLCAGDSDNNQLDGVTKCKSIMCAHICVVPYKTSNTAERSARCHGRQTIYPMVTVSAEMSDNPRPSLVSDRKSIIANCEPVGGC